MAIYEPRGSQVELTGPQRAVGFNPEETYNPNNAFLNKVEQDSQLANQQLQQQQRADQARLERSASEMEALAGFSDTLGKFLLDYTQKKRKRDIASGYAKFIRGETRIKPEAQIKHQQQTAVLQTAATADGKLARAAAEIPGNEGSASTIIKASPALRGWEAEGAAIAQAQSAPTELEAFLNSQKSSGRTIQYTNPDGTTESIVLSRNIRGDQVRKAVEVLTTEWIEQSGFSNLNPMLVQEHGGFNMFLAQKQITTNWQKDADEAAIGLAKDMFRAKAGQLFSAVKDPATAQEAFAQLEADPLLTNQEKNERYALALQNDVETRQGLQALGNLSINGIPLKDYFRDQYKNAEERIDKAAAERAATLQTSYNEWAQTAINAIGAAPTIAEGERLRQQAIKEAQQRGMGTEVISKLQTADVNATVNGLRENFQKGNPLKITSGELDGLVALYPFLKDEAETWKNMVPQAEDLKRTFDRARGEAEVIINAHLANRSKFKLGKEPLILKALTLQSLNLVSTQLFAKYAGGDKVPDQAELAREIAAQSIQQFATKGSPVQINTQGQPVNPEFLTPTPGAKISLEDWIPPTLDAKKIKATADRLDRQMAGRYSPNTQVVPLEYFDDLQSMEDQGVDHTKNTLLVGAAKQAGQTVDQFIRSQAALAGFEWKPNKNKEQTRKALLDKDPQAAELFNNIWLAPDYRRAREREIERVSEQRANLQQLNIGADAGKVITPLMQSILDGESSGGNYDAVNRGGAGDTPGGLPGLSKMTLAQVMQQRNAGYRHFGAYQFNPDTMMAVAQRLGINPNAVFNKETQQRLAYGMIYEEALPWRGGLNDFVQGRSTNIAAARNDIRTEWSALRNVSDQQLDTMLRQARQQRAESKRQTSLASFRPKVYSVTLERGGPRDQPGLDIYFEDKQFPAVIDGVVKDKGFDSGYGYYTVVESISPISGERVDVLYSHQNAPGPVQIGQTVRKGQIIGQQGSAGNVRGADSITSIDFFKPAPRGSRSMAPYQGWRKLAESIKRELGK
jgi:murein DD-endopeptidase MepM/ murein hydrolase activator NlpD